MTHAVNTVIIHVYELRQNTEWIILVLYVNLNQNNLANKEMFY